MASTVVRYEKQGDIARITIDSPPVNSLSQAVVEGLVEGLTQANADQAVRAVVIHGAGENFVAGADIGELEQAVARAGSGELAPELTRALDTMEANAKPIVMAIDGFALGGGLELAMAGHRRVGTTRCRVGLPELRLGLIPGAGGTQRLPRLICQKLPGLAGLQKAAEMMLTSSEARGSEAAQLGIVDELVEPEKLLEAASAAALKLADGELEKIQASKLGGALCTADEAAGFRMAAVAMAGDKIRNLVHPELCLDAILTGAVDGFEAGIRREQENFAKCLATSQAAGLIHVFFATRAAPKVPGVTDQKFPVQSFKKAAVLGGGTMGSGIATSLLYAGLDVILREVDAAAADAGRGRIEANLASRLKKGKLSQEKYDAMLARLHPQTGYDGFDQIDIVIEAVIENIDLKQEVFAELERAVRPDCVLATNTSTIDIEVVGARTKAQRRILGTHFFSPAHIMPLVEIVRSRETDPVVLNSVIALAKQLKKTPVTVGNCVGFLVNRIFFPYGQAAGLLVDYGIDPYRLDQAVYDFGMPMGPFRMSDLAGVDVAKFAGGIMAEAYADRTYVSSLGELVFAEKRFGQKTGRGYYLYPDGKNSQPDPELATLVARARADAGNPKPLDLDDQQIVERVFFGVVNEACRCLDEGIAIRASDIDIACVMGMGFPPYRGGVMKWADMLGARYVAEQLSAWSAVHGKVYEPCAYLLNKAERNESFFA